LEFHNLIKPDKIGYSYNIFKTQPSPLHLLNFLNIKPRLIKIVLSIHTKHYKQTPIVFAWIQSYGLPEFLP
jgi:hypothetical protein